jgi:hypothetical protein
MDMRDHTTGPTEAPLRYDVLPDGPTEGFRRIDPIGVLASETLPAGARVRSKGDARAGAPSIPLRRAALLPSALLPLPPIPPRFRERRAAARFESALPIAARQALVPAELCVAHHVGLSHARVGEFYLAALKQRGHLLDDVNATQQDGIDGVDLPDHRPLWRSTGRRDEV